MKLIVNADDFGLCRGVNHGIVDAFKEGIVRSTTMMVGMTGEAHAVELARANPGLKIGIHLRLTAGTPISHHLKTLTNDQGGFLDQGAFYGNQDIRSEEIEQEFRAQIKHFLALGLTPTHLDSHHHCYGHPRAQPVIKALSSEYNLPYRTVDSTQVTELNGGTYRFTDRFYGDTSEQMLLDIIDEELTARGQNAILEMMCHPAYIDPVLNQSSSYTQARVKEFEVLTSQSLKQALDDRDVELIDYSTIAPLF